MKTKLKVKGTPNQREREREVSGVHGHPAEGRGWGGRSPDSKYATAIKATLDAVVRAKKSAQIGNKLCIDSDAWSVSSPM